MKKSTLDWVVIALLVIGGLNWGLVGLANFNLVEVLFGSLKPLPQLTYIIVGLCALYVLYKEMQDK